MDFKDILYRIIEGKKNICLLCYQNTEDLNGALEIIDEVTLNNQETVTIKDILNLVIGTNVTEETFSSHICKQCTKSAIDSYIFKKKCQKNYDYLATAIKSLTATLDNPVDNIIECESLYLIWDEKNLVYQKYYRSISSDSDSATKTKSLGGQKKRKFKQKATRAEDISITDMIYDKNDKKCLTCKVCLNTFSSTGSLRKHYTRLHMPKKFQCNKCLKQYTTPWYLKHHMAYSHNNCICNQCGKTYNNLQSLKSHMLTHNVKIVCQVCGRVFKHEHSFNKHMELNICKQRRRVAAEQGNFICDICKKKFCKKASLKIHIGFIHGNKKGYSCDWCEKRFSDKGKLRVHMVSHTQQKNFTCEYCGVSFSKNESLVNHRRIHTGEKPFPCEYCEERFRTVYHFKEHMRHIHSKARLECDICQKKFNVVSYLKDHRIKHFDSNNKLYEPTLIKEEEE